jgi:hypothetical protein
VLKSLLEDLASKNRSIVFWNWSRVNMSIFVGFDNKDVEFFKNHETLDQLIHGKYVG